MKRLLFNMLLLSLVACSNEETIADFTYFTEPTYTIVDRVTSIEFANAKETIMAGGSISFAEDGYSTFPEDVTSHTISWSLTDVSPTGCATIDSESGLIESTESGSGVVVVTATSIDGTVVSDSCEIFFEDNMVLNPGFEDGTTNWFDATAVAVTTSNVISGSKSLSYTGNGWYGKILQTIEGVEAGKTYVVGFSGRVQNAAGASGSQSYTAGALRAQVFYNYDNDTSNKSSNLDIATNVDTTVSMEVEIPVDADRVVINIFKTNYYCYLDDVFFYEKH